MIIADCCVQRLVRDGDRVVGAGSAPPCRRRLERLVIRADHVFVCAGAVRDAGPPARSGIRCNAGNWLKMHPTVKIAACYFHLIDHGDVAMHRITEFVPSPTIGGSASRRGHIVMALADTGLPFDEALADWENISVYYAIRSEGSGRVLAVPGLASPVVTYKLTEGDLSRLARGIVYLGELLLAAGATELHPSILEDRWCAAPTSWARGGCPHLEPRQPHDRAPSTAAARTANARGPTASVGHRNLRVNDALLLPGRPRRQPPGGDHGHRRPQLRRVPRAVSAPSVPAALAPVAVVTGASGWLGQNPVRTLAGSRERAVVPAAALDEAPPSSWSRPRSRQSPATRNSGHCGPPVRWAGPDAACSTPPQ